MDTANIISQYLTFKLENDTYAINVISVREVMKLKLKDMTKIPKTPDYHKGVISVRGSVVPVIDMRVKFNIVNQEITSESSIIVLEIPINGKKTILGILTDSVKEVIDLDRDQIVDPPEIGNQLNMEFIEGIGKRNEEFIIILKIEKIINSEELHNLSSLTERCPNDKSIIEEEDVSEFLVGASRN